VEVKIEKNYPSCNGSGYDFEDGGQSIKE